MSKIDKDFVENNLDKLSSESYKNAERLFEEAKYLRGEKHYSRSLFIAITALEELAKWHFLSKSSIDYNKLEKLSTHSFKLGEILEIFRNVASNQALQKDDLDWLKSNRLIEMREDVLYVRLNKRGNDGNYPISPDEKYWQKRTKAMLGLLKYIFSHYKENQEYK